jgi:hypothetical protein
VVEAAARQWFGKQPDTVRQRLAAAEAQPAGSLFGAAKIFSALLLLLNAPFLFVSGAALGAILLGLVLLWVPALLYKGS